MQLIPFDTNQNEDGLSLNPIEKNRHERANILQNTKMNKSEKLNLLNKSIVDYNILTKKKIQNKKTNINKIDFDFLSFRLKSYAESFLNELLKREKFKLDNNEIILNNFKFLGSNIIDLVVDLISEKKNQQEPQYLKEFLTFLIEIQFPLTLIKNKIRVEFINQLKNYQSNVDPIPNSSTRKRKVQISTPLKFKKYKKSVSPKKKVVWP